MSGTLYLIPNRISFTAPAETLPQETLAAVRGCRRFLAENARDSVRSERVLYCRGGEETVVETWQNVLAYL